MVLPLLSSLEVRLTPRSLYLRNEKLAKSGPSVPMKTAPR